MLVSSISCGESNVFLLLLPVRRSTLPDVSRAYYGANAVEGPPAPLSPQITRLFVHVGHAFSGASACARS